MNKQDSEKDLLLVSIFSFLTVSLWIFFELVKTAKTSTIESTTRQIVQPLNTEIDTGILDILEQRRNR